MTSDFPRNDLPVEELLRQDHYTTDELAELLGMSPYIIREAARAGDLQATTIDHHILSIDRADVLSWLERRG